MSSSKSDHSQDNADHVKDQSNPEQLLNQALYDSFVNPISSENSSSTSPLDPSITAADPIDNPSTEFGQICISTIEASYIPGKGTIVEIKKNGETIHVTRPYGLGVDTHKKFISVTLITCSNLQYIRFQQDFPTTSNGILGAKEWALELIATYCDPPVPDDEPSIIVSKVLLPFTTQSLNCGAENPRS